MKKKTEFSYFFQYNNKKGFFINKLYNNDYIKTKLGRLFSSKNRIP